jgi:hypothetical protein
MRDIVAARDLAHRLPVAVAPADRLAPLVLGQFRRSAKLDAARPGPLAALAGARPDKVALELRQPAQHRQHQAAVRRRGVGPCVAERAQAGSLAGDRRDGVQQVAGRAGEAVEPRHHQHVAGVELSEQAAELRPVGLGSARHFAEHLARPMPPQRRDLRCHALSVRRDPRIAVDHGVTLSPDFCTGKAQLDQELDFGVKILISAPRGDYPPSRSVCRQEGLYRPELTLTCRAGFGGEWPWVGRSHPSQGQVDD